jgi:hypothetical protein
MSTNGTVRHAERRSRDRVRYDRSREPLPSGQLKGTVPCRDCGLPCRWWRVKASGRYILIQPINKVYVRHRCSAKQAPFGTTFKVTQKHMDDLERVRQEIERM